MDNQIIQPGASQTDFIRQELNFDVNPEDPLTKATLIDHATDDWIDILGNGQLKKKVIKSGEKGTRPNTSDICTLSIIGRLKDDKVVEDHKEIVIQLGDVEVIQGLDLAIALMDVGEVAEVEVASRFAYGKLGKHPDIPPDATIWYTVTLKLVKLETEIETLSVNQRQEIGNQKRERGNWWFTRDEPTLAIQCYRRALKFLLPTKDDTSTLHTEAEDFASDAELQALLEDRVKVYNNLAAAQMKTQAYDAALKSIEGVLSCQPKNVKALFRKGKILHQKREYASAYTILQQAAAIEPDTKAIQVELTILKEKRAKYVQHEKNLYRKMLGTQKPDKDIKSVNLKNGNKHTSKFTWSLIGGATAAVLGVLVYRFVS